MRFPVSSRSVSPSIHWVQSPLPLLRFLASIPTFLSCSAVYEICLCLFMFRFSFFLSSLKRSQHWFSLLSPFSLSFCLLFLLGFFLSSPQLYHRAAFLPANTFLPFTPHSVISISIHMSIPEQNCITCSYLQQSGRKNTTEVDTNVSDKTCSNQRIHKLERALLIDDKNVLNATWGRIESWQIGQERSQSLLFTINHSVSS